MSTRILIRGGCVLTLGARTQNFNEGDVLIEDGKIVEVGTGLRSRDAEVVDATDTIVMPGFVDTHRHAWKSLFRNLGAISADGKVTTTAGLGAYFEAEDVYAATLIGLLGAVEAGVTTVVDWSDIQRDPSCTEAALQAHADAGLRTVFVPHWDDDNDRALERSAGNASAVAGSMTTLGYGPDDLQRSAVDRITGSWAAARRLGLRIHTHLGPLAEPGLVSELADQGLIKDDITLVHCSAVNDADLDAIASSGASISITPSSDMAKGFGWPPVQRLIDRGIRPGLGVDDESVAPGDIFAQMRAANSLQHAHLFDLKLAGKAGIPNLLSTREVIRYGTIDGAKAIGLADSTGSIEPGKQADLIVLRTDRPNIHPINDPIGAVVWGMDTSNIDTVIAGGRILLHDGALQTDLRRVRTLATVSHERISSAASLFAATPTGGVS